MIDGIILGSLSWLSLYMTWSNLPSWVRRRTLAHPLVSELLAGLLTWAFITAISKSLIAVIGATMTGLLVNVTFKVYEYLGWKE